MLRPFALLVALSVLVLACSRVVAQDQPEFPGPVKQHQLLKKFVGDWTTTSSGSMGPDEPPMECSGVIKSRMIGDRWVVNEMQSHNEDMPMHGLQTIGYSPEKKKFVGTWVDSMTNHLWIYEGELDASGNKLTLEAEGPNFMGEGKPALFRDAYEFKSPDLILITSSMQGEDGKWITFMTGESKRQPAADE